VKIISFYHNEKQLIKKAASGKRDAQQYLYDKFAPKMLSVCRQYIKDVQFAEDVMVNGFVKVFKHLESFKHEGSFEGWIRRIMTISSSLDVEHIQMLIDDLPEGYKMVFVLYAVEGYKHAEIAEMLGIAESTSKSQLFKARRMLQEKLKKQNILGYGTH